MIVFLKRFVNKKDYFLSIIFALLISVDAFVMPQMVCSNGHCTC